MRSHLGADGEGVYVALPRVRWHLRFPQFDHARSREVAGALVWHARGRRLHLGLSDSGTEQIWKVRAASPDADGWSELAAFDVAGSEAVGAPTGTGALLRRRGTADLVRVTALSVSGRRGTLPAALKVAGERVVVRARTDGNRGPFYVRTMLQDGAFPSPAPTHGDGGGAHPVAVDRSARIAVVGLPANAARSRGAAQVFASDSGGWRLVTELHAPAGIVDRGTFGAAVAVDGQQIVVGAPGAGGLSAADPSAPGGAYVFRRDAHGSWTFTRALRAPARADEARLGSAVVAAGDVVAVAGRRTWIASKADGSLRPIGSGAKADEASPVLRTSLALDRGGQRLVVGQPDSNGGAGQVTAYAIGDASAKPLLRVQGRTGQEAGLAVTISDDGSTLAYTAGSTLHAGSPTGRSISDIAMPDTQAVVASAALAPDGSAVAVATSAGAWLAPLDVTRPSFAPVSPTAIPGGLLGLSFARGHLYVAGGRGPPQNSHH